MCPQASYPHVHTSSTPAARPEATPASSSEMSSRVSPKLGTQSCGSTPFRDAVSARSVANRSTNGPAGSPKFFQYGSVASLESPGSDATVSQSEIPCAPSVSGKRQIVLRPPRAATCAHISRRKSTVERSRNTRTSSVSSCGIGAPNCSWHASQRQAQRSASAPTCSGTVQCGSSQNTKSVPASRAASAHSRQNARYAGLFRHPVATRRPSSSTWHASGWNVTQRLSASPPNVRPRPHGHICTSSPSSCDAATISAIVPR